MITQNALLDDATPIILKNRIAYMFCLTMENQDKLSFFKVDRNDPTTMHAHLVASSFGVICDETYEVGKSAHETIRTKSMVTLYSFASTLRFAIDQFKASSKPTKEVLLILRHFTQACTSVKASIIDCILDGLERWASVSGAPSVAKAGRSLGKSPTSISILKTHQQHQEPFQSPC